MFEQCLVLALDHFESADALPMYTPVVSASLGST